MHLYLLANTVACVSITRTVIVTCMDAWLIESSQKSILLLVFLLVFAVILVDVLNHLPQFSYSHGVHLLVV